MTGKAIIPRILVPDEICGPAMLALNPPMRAFAYEWVFGGSKTQKDAAIAAGYSNTGDSAKTQGHELMRRPDVQAAIEELSRNLLRTEGPASIRELIRLRSNAKDERVRLKASEAILDRCGLGSTSHQHVTVDHNVKLPEAELDRRIASTLRELGFSEDEARKALIDPSRVIEGDFVEVPREPPTTEDLAAEAERERDRETRRRRKGMTPEQIAEDKRQVRERRTAEQKAKYAAAQTDIEDAIAAADDDHDDLFVEGW
jgi:phage terminase small subunit